MSSGLEVGVGGLASGIVSGWGVAPVHSDSFDARNVNPVPPQMWQSAGKSSKALPGAPRRRTNGSHESSYWGEKPASWNAAPREWSATTSGLELEYMIGLSGSLGMYETFSTRRLSGALATTSLF
jgi:hypothetical protein